MCSVIDERCFKIGRPRGNLTFFSLIFSYYQCNHTRFNAIPRFFPFSSSKLENSYFFIWLILSYIASLCTPIATPNPPSGFICNVNLLAPIISLESYGFNIIYSAFYSKDIYWTSNYMPGLYTRDMAVNKEKQSLSWSL